MKTVKVDRGQFPLLSERWGGGLVAAICEKAISSDETSVAIAEVELLALYRAATRRQGLGSFIEGAVKPIARALRLKCLDQDGQLKPESPCAKRRDALNRLTQRS